MSEVIRPNVLHRIRYTPLRDVVRGRLSGRLDVDRRIDASDLPEPAKALVKRVVKRTRLWSLEKVDVADELIAHFADGIESGATVEQLIESFGDERIAARLIRRAKKRSRPIIWHLARGIGWTVLVILLIYVLLAIRFFTGVASPRVDYIAELNQSIESTPPEQRAWPIYRQALLAIGSHQQRKDLSKLASVPPNDPSRSELNHWLEEHQELLRLVHEASAKPAIGFILGPGGSAEDPELWPQQIDFQREPLWRDSLLFVSTSQVNELHLLASLLAADAALARKRGESDRLNRDLNALLNLSDQLRSENWPLGYLLVISERMSLLAEINATLTDAPELLSDADLQALAHRLSAPDTAAALFDLRPDRVRFFDAVQRSYTDDGAGGGRLTPDGLRYSIVWPYADLAQRDRLIRAILPTIALSVASRREVLSEFDRVMNMAESRLSKPIREADWKPFRRQIDHWRDSGWGGTKYWLVTGLIPPLDYFHITAERFLGQRDGVLVGLALERYRRQHGQYPQTLDELTPLLLPRVPLDRITGEPLRYKLVEGKPLIYSVGADRDDDGGRPPVSRGGDPEPWRAANWIPRDCAADGDWILYPEHRVSE